MSHLHLSLFEEANILQTANRLNIYILFFRVKVNNNFFNYFNYNKNILLKLKQKIYNNLLNMFVFTNQITHKKQNTIYDVCKLHLKSKHTFILIVPEKSLV